MPAKTLKSKTEKFLSCKNIAVIGVSSTNDQEAANYNFKKLKRLGYRLFPVNPSLDAFEGQTCFSSVKAIDEKVEAALVFTHPNVTPQVIEECCEQNIKNIWVHRSFGQGSCSSPASQFMATQDVNFIDGACPMMFIPNADLAHRIFYHLMKFTGKLPK